MKLLRLRLHETREILKLELADTDTLHDLRRRINPTAPSSAHLSFNRKNELLACSGMEGQEPMNVEISPAVSKRLSIPFFLKKILLEKSGDTSELTTLALSVHAVMLESGFLLLDHGSDKFSFSKELLSVSLRYSMLELITRKDTNTVESITVRFQNIGPGVVVYGTLGGSCEQVHMTYLDKRRFVPVIELVLDTLKFEKESFSRFYREVFMFWRMVKDDLVIPLLSGLCDKAGLEYSPCLMRLPTELKLKILESLPGVSIGNMACVCTEMRYLASDNDLWKQKCLEEAKDHIWTLTGEVNWKRNFAAFRRQQKRLIFLARRNLPTRRSDPRFPLIIRDPFDPRDPRGPRDPFDPRGQRDHFDRRGPFKRRGPFDPFGRKAPFKTRDPSA